MRTCGFIKVALLWGRTEIMGKIKIHFLWVKLRYVFYKINEIRQTVFKSISKNISAFVLSENDKN